MKWTNNALLLGLAATAVVTTNHLAAADAPISPFPVTKTTTDRDGNAVTVTECPSGSAKNHHVTTCVDDGEHGNSSRGGYTIETDAEGRACIAQRDENAGTMVCSDCLVAEYEAGTCDPAKMGILANEIEDEDVALAQCGAKCHEAQNSKINPVIENYKRQKNQRAAAVAQGKTVRRGRRREQVDAGTDLVNTMQNLVLLIRFADHVDRTLPSEEDVGVLFNAIDSDHPLAPTGSVRDCFRFNSYNKFDLESKICNWCTVPKDEKYYGDYNSGMTAKLGEAIRHCLDVCQTEYDLSQFDINDDSELDAIAILHSGYGAEWMASDCQNPDPNYDFNSQIWSHKWELSPDRQWTGTAGITVKNYHISPALWGTCGSAIGRIGVICHETGHFFGLPDLYDGTGGNGVATTDLMGNSWGYDGSQYYPPLMSAWSKLRLGWAEPQIITSSGQYVLGNAQLDDKVLAFVHPCYRHEYFLMENKQNNKIFDAKLPQPGITIYHIDDTAPFDAEGYPDGTLNAEWPDEHYRVAVMQADGKYDMERGLSFGDATDFFHGQGAKAFGPQGVDAWGVQQAQPHPNTDWYSTGQLVKSGFKIFDMSDSASVMSFQVEIDATVNIVCPAKATTTTTTTTAKVAKEEYDFGGADTESSGNTCTDVKGLCQSHTDCCSVPKMRCKGKVEGKFRCKVKKPKVKKMRERKAARRMLLQLHQQKNDE